MRGAGSYNYYEWGYYSPPSNLSASAVPFSVNRPSSSIDLAPFMDYANSTDTVPDNPNHYPFLSRPHAYDLFPKAVRNLDSATPSSKPYGYSGLQVLESSGHDDSLGLDSKIAFSYDQSSNSKKPNLVEAQPYFPSYVSPPMNYPPSSVAPSHWSVLSEYGSSLGDYANKSPELGFAGQSAELWNQFAEFNKGKGKQVGVENSSSSEQPNLTGSVVEERMNQGCQDVEDTNIVEVSRMIDSGKHGADQLDDKCWWGTIKPMPVEFSGTFEVQSPSVSLETHHEAPLKLFADSGNHHLSSAGTYDKDMRQHDELTRVDMVSSTPKTGIVTDLNIGNYIAGGDLGHNNFFKIKEAYHLSSPGIAGCFDSDHLRMHLERNEPSSTDNAMISDKNVPKDVVNYAFKARYGSQNPHPSLDNLSLRLSATEDVNSAEKSFECGDRCNPAVDSPCWKGAPAAHFSPHEYSDVLHPEYVHQKEERFGSVIQEPQNFLLDPENNVRKSCEISNSYQTHSSEGSPRKFSVTKFTSEDCKSNGAVNAGPYQAEPSCDYELQYLDDITKLRQNIVSSTKPMNCESGSSHTKHQVTEESKSISLKQQSGAEAGHNVNKCLEFGTSHTAEHALSLPSLAVDAPPAPEKTAGKVSSGKLNVQMLIDSMQNLSELLLYHCLNDASELKERDCNILKNVISNLNTCASKKAEQITAAQECLFHEPETSRCSGESCEVQQNASFKRPHLIKKGSENSKVELENLLVREANLYSRSEKPHWNLSDSISSRADTEMTKADNMTKALKRILSENFPDDEGAESQTILYKNLWLEAEAALCSANYRARYNQMKIEMEKHSYKKRAMVEESKTKVVPSLSDSQNAAAEVQNYLSPDSSSHDFAPPVMNEPNALTPEGKGGQDLDSFIQNDTIPSTNKEAAGHDEASVMARYLLFKARLDESCINTTNLEEPLDIADKLAPGGRDNQNQVNFCQDPPIPGINKADYDASVFARFHILKSRVEDSNSVYSEGKLLDGVGFTGKGIDDSVITKNASENKSFDVYANPSVMHLNSYAAVDKPIPKEYHMDLEDNQGIQHPTYYSDGIASDWEHVE